jgi:hypothetical protein
VRTLQGDTIFKGQNQPLPDIESAGALTVDFLPSGTVRNKVLLFINYPMYCLLIDLFWLTVSEGSIHGCLAMFLGRTSWRQRKVFTSWWTGSKEEQ